MERFPHERVKFNPEASTPPEFTPELIRLLSATRQALDEARGKNLLASVKDAQAYAATIDELEGQLRAKVDEQDEKRRNAITTLCTIERITLRRRLQKTINRTERYPDEIQEEAIWQRQVVQYLSQHEENPDAREQFWRQYDLLFGNDEHVEGNIFRVGIAGQYAAMKFLHNTVGSEVYFSKSREDIHDAIDCFAVAPKGTVYPPELILPTQVKTIQIERQNMIRDLNSLVEVIPPEEFGYATGEHVDAERNKFLRGCDRFARALEQNCGEEGVRTPQVFGLYLRIPYKIEKMAGYMTQVLQLQRGELDPNMVEFLCQQFREGLKKHRLAESFPVISEKAHATATKSQQRSSRR